MPTSSGIHWYINIIETNCFYTVKACSVSSILHVLCTSHEFSHKTFRIVSYNHNFCDRFQVSSRLSEPIYECDVSKDYAAVTDTVDRYDDDLSLQILPDFYPEHTNLAMNKKRRITVSQTAFVAAAFFKSGAYFLHCILAARWALRTRKKLSI